MSTSAAPAKSRDTTEASRWMWSAHSGSRPVRTDREIPMITTATPSVAKVRRWAHSTLRTLRCPCSRERVRPSSGIQPPITAEHSDIAAANRKTTGSPKRWMRPAPSSGPTKTPSRNDPPSSDIARARWESGVASMRKPCRAIRNAVQLIPLTKTATESTATELLRNATVIATASSAPAPINVRRSPILATNEPAGREVARDPIPSSAMTNAAIDASAPRSEARSASTGITAPCPMELTIEGAYATTAMSRKRNSSVVVSVVTPLLCPIRYQGSLFLLLRETSPPSAETSLPSVEWAPRCPLDRRG